MEPKGLSSYARGNRGIRACVCFHIVTRKRGAEEENYLDGPCMFLMN